MAARPSGLNAKSPQTPTRPGVPPAHAYRKCFWYFLHPLGVKNTKKATGTPWAPQRGELAVDRTPGRADRGEPPGTWPWAPQRGEPAVWTGLLGAAARRAVGDVAVGHMASGLVASRPAASGAGRSPRAARRRPAPTGSCGPGWVPPAAARRASSGRPAARGRRPARRRRPGATSPAAARATAARRRPRGRPPPGSAATTTSMVSSSGWTLGQLLPPERRRHLGPGPGPHRPGAEHRLVRGVLVEVDEHPPAPAPPSTRPRSSGRAGAAPVHGPRPRRRPAPRSTTTAAAAGRRRGCPGCRWSSATR